MVVDPSAKPQIQKKASSLNFDWLNKELVLNKVDEELDELWEELDEDGGKSSKGVDLEDKSKINEVRWNNRRIKNHKYSKSSWTKNYDRMYV